MSLNDNAKKLAEYVSGVIEKEKQEAYQTGYTKGYDKAWKEAETIHVKGLMEWMRLMEVHYDSKPKDAPSAMDTMPVAPVPCRIKDSTTIKDFFQKMNEELDELKQEVFQFGSLNDEIGDSAYILKGGDSYTLEDADLDKEDRMRIAEEAADLITAATSLMEALGIGFKERNEAQRRVNEHNHERGRN